MARLLSSGLCAQASPPNRVLELDGKGSFVGLPAGMFDALPAATVEAWVRFETFVEDSRVFDFGIESRQMYLSHYGRTPRLKYLLADPDNRRNRIEVEELWPLKRWCHVACVSGPGGLKLYFNGRLVLAAGPATHGAGGEAAGHGRLDR